MSEETTTATFTEAEEAFIEASIPVIHAGAALEAAERGMQEAGEATAPFAQELDLQDDLPSARRLTQLMIEAAHRAGFDDDSAVVDALNQTQVELETEYQLRAAFEQMYAEQAAAQTLDANPVI